MSNRFDFEQQIMDCWRITDDLEMVYDKVMNGDYNTDTISNLLLGLISLYNLKFERCFDTFEQCVNNKEL